MSDPAPQTSHDRNHQSTVTPIPGNGVAASPLSENATPLFSAEDCNGLEEEWDAIQASFVDEPKQAVEQADRLVSKTIGKLSDMFTAERAGLERKWDQGTGVTTEDLRLALQRYRSFFHRLLQI
jgi:hypothetical protein